MSTQINFVDFLKEMNTEDSWDRLASQYRQAKHEAEMACNRLEEIKTKLIGLMAGDKREGNGVKVVRQECKGNVDYKRVPELLNVDLDKYRKPSYHKFVVTCIN